MSHELTLKGNPCQLTINQHFHSAHAIEKFYDFDNKVEVKLLQSGKIVKMHKRAKIFCAKRAWDHGSEIGYMKKIEIEFHREINIINNYSQRNHSAISKYFLLWQLRHQFHLTIVSDNILEGISCSGYTGKEEEIIERKGAFFVKKSGIIPARFIAGVSIRVLFDFYWPQFRQMKWGLSEAIEGEFLISDGYHDVAFMPIAPTFAFLGGKKDQRLSKNEMASLNTLTIRAASEYYFSRKINNCPLI